MLAFDKPLLWRQASCFEIFCNRMQELLSLPDPQIIKEIADLEFRIWQVWQQQWGACYKTTSETHLSLCFQAVTLHHHYRELLLLRMQEAAACLHPKKDPARMEALQHVFSLEKELLRSFVHSQAQLLNLPPTYEVDFAHELESEQQFPLGVNITG